MEEGFYARRTAGAGTAMKSSAPELAEAEVCWREASWSLICDTAALLFPCMGRKERNTFNEYCNSTCCQQSVQCSLPNKVLRPGSKIQQK